jgi:hypothetical protein
MSKFVEKLKKRNAAQEQRRIGDIYAECMRKGCNEDFLKAFDGRIWLFPVEQTTAFLESVKNGRDMGNTQKYLMQWKIYLEVILEKRPNHDKASEWEKALSMLK